MASTIAFGSKSLRFESCLSEYVSCGEWNLLARGLRKQIVRKLWFSELYDPDFQSGTTDDYVVK